MLIKKSSAALLATIMSPIDAIVVESMHVVLNIPTLALAAIGTPVAGGMLLVIYAVKHKITILAAWKYLLVISILFAITEFAWYDAVSRIGAGKTALINTPLETVCIALFALIFLCERLARYQIIGACIVTIGVIIVLSSSATLAFGIGIGEIEAIVASVSTAGEIILTAKLLSKYDSIEVTAFTLIMAGLVLNLQWLIPRSMNTITSTDWVFILLFSFVPMILFLSYYISIKKIGTSLTSIITSASIIVTVIAQLVLAQFSVDVKLPENMTVALIGGMVSVLGMGIVFARG